MKKYFHLKYLVPAFIILILLNAEILELVKATFAPILWFLISILIAYNIFKYIGKKVIKSFKSKTR